MLKPAAFLSLVLVALCLAGGCKRPAAASPSEASRPITVGEPAPATLLSSHQGQPLSLAAYHGQKVLLWFYPAASTPGCTTEGLGLQARLLDFKKRGVQVVGVSVDPPAKNAEFAALQGFAFPLLSDPARTLAMRFGAADSPDAPYARRVSALIDERGVVRKLYPKVTPATHAAEVLADVDALGPSAPRP